MADPRFMVSVHENKVYVMDDDFGWDAMLEVTGDFESKEVKANYAQAIADALNVAGKAVPVADLAGSYFNGDGKHD